MVAPLTLTASARDLLLVANHSQPVMPTMPSGSVRVAITGFPSLGCSGDRVSVPISSTFNTAILTDFWPIAPALSVTLKVTSYTLSRLASFGSSKSGGLMKWSLRPSPWVLYSKRAPSGPAIGAGQVKRSNVSSSEPR